MEQLATDFGRVVLSVHPVVAAMDDSFTVDEDSDNNSLAVIDNDSPQDGSVTIDSVGPTSAGGSVTISANGLQAVYSPAANFSGTETFSYTLLHTSGASDAATVTVNVSNLNDPPTAGDDLFLDIPEDSVNVSLTVLTNDDGAPDLGETITVTLVGTPDQGGIAVISQGGMAVAYTPRSVFFGVETIVYTVSDGNGGTDQATIIVEVVNVNDDPTAVADSFSIVRESQNNDLDVLANDLITPDRNESLLITVVGATSAGGSATVAANAKSILYSAPTDFSGQDTFTYTIEDGNGGSSQTTVTVQIYNAWTNQNNRFDVDNNGLVTPRDVLLLINELNINGARVLPDPETVIRTPWLFLDTNNDDIFSPADVLVDINYLNSSLGQGEGEGEAWHGQLLAAGRTSLQARTVDDLFGVEETLDYRTIHAVATNARIQPDSRQSSRPGARVSERASEFEFATDSLEDLLDTLCDDVASVFCESPRNEFPFTP